MTDQLITPEVQQVDLTADERSLLLDVYRSDGWAVAEKVWKTVGSNLALNALRANQGHDFLRGYWAGFVSASPAIKAVLDRHRQQVAPGLTEEAFYMKWSK